MSMSMDLRTGLWVWEQVGNTMGDPWYGRPARYVRRGAIICSPIFINFHFVYILTLKTRLDMRCPLTHPAPGRLRRHHLPCMQEQAGGERLNVHGLLMPFSSPTPPLPARLSRIWTFMAFWHCPRLFHLPCTQDRTGGGFMACSGSGSSART